ncbi:MAG: biotin transporter BioY, partial [Planctomycetota bacterium]
MTVLTQHAQRTRQAALTADVLKVLSGTAALALASRIAIPVQPVPITAQTLALLVVAGLLGRVRGTMAVGTLLAAGAAGAPVFTQGAGLAYLVGPTGGYLLGFLPAAWVVGELMDRGWGRHAGRLLLALLAGHATVFAFGLGWLGLLTGLMGTTLLAAGLVPFLPGMAIKTVLA